MYTIKAAAAAVTGARHLRIGRNGQDAAAAWTGEAAGRAAGTIAVCDGCGASASSEVGARLGARLVTAAIATRLVAGARPGAVWAGVRDEVVAALARLADAMVARGWGGCADGGGAGGGGAGGATGVDDAGEREAVIRAHFLFTVVAAAVVRDEVCVWAIGDGAYRLADRVRVLGPFADNQPPYLAYDLLGVPGAAHVEAADARAGAVLVATDGAAELGGALLDPARLGAALDHPDGLRRRLALLARGEERIDWGARRIARTPAALQDDGAIAVLRWQP